MAGSGKTIEVLLEYAIEIENKAAGIYGTLSKLFAHVPGLAAFWQGLRDDEIKHGEILHETRSLLTGELLLRDPGNERWECITGMQRMLKKNLLKDVHTLDDAYELAHDLESSEINAIFQFLAGECIPSVQRKQLIRSMIEQHQKKLSDFDESFGNRDWRRGIKILPKSD